MDHLVVSLDGGIWVEPRGNVLPIYFVADESGSMGPHIDKLNRGLVSLQDQLQKESFAAAKVRFAVIGFAESAETYLQLADLRSLPSMPTLQARSSTSYAAAFDQLAYRIFIDVPALKAQGFAVHRPAVFFLTDGLPNQDENWRSIRSDLLAQHERPNILAFGIGNADAAIIREVATDDDYAWVAAKGWDTGAALSRFITSLTQSVISSGQGLASGASQLQLEKPEGFSLAVEVL